MGNLIRENGFIREGNVGDSFGQPFAVTYDTAAGNRTLGIGELMSDLYMSSGSTAAFNETMPTGAAIDAAYPNLPIGFIHRLFMWNNSPYICTLVAAAGFTKIGATASVIQPGGLIAIIITKTAAATWTFEATITAGSPSQVMARITTVGAATLTAAQLAATNIIRTGSVGAYSDTLPTGASMPTVFGNLAIGTAVELRIFNNTAFVQTILAGAAFTIVAGSPVTIAANSSAICQLVCTAAATWTFEIVG